VEDFLKKLFDVPLSQNNMPLIPSSVLKEIVADLFPKNYEKKYQKS